MLDKKFLWFKVLLDEKNFFRWVYPKWGMMTWVVEGWYPYLLLLFLLKLETKEFLVPCSCLGILHMSISCIFSMRYACCRWLYAMHVLKYFVSCKWIFGELHVSHVVMYHNIVRAHLTSWDGLKNILEVTFDVRGFLPHIEVMRFFK